MMDVIKRRSSKYAFIFQVEILSDVYVQNTQRISSIRQIQKMLGGGSMKFVCFNTKEPKIRDIDLLDALKKECEIKVCELDKSMIFCTKDATYKTSRVVDIKEIDKHILVETKNSYYLFEK